jgi:hypothetical protein
LLDISIFENFVPSSFQFLDDIPDSLGVSCLPLTDKLPSCPKEKPAAGPAEALRATIRLKALQAELAGYEVILVRGPVRPAGRVNEGILAYPGDPPLH